NFAQYKLPEILKEFSKQYPHVQFMVNTGWSTKVMDLLGTSSVHLGILRGDYDWNGERFLLDKERLCIISKSEIQLKDLPNLPLIDYHTDSSLKRLINRWWQETFT
ncbi:substrate-binding domain-containing protein, partial [Bacillus safensis]